MQQHSRKAVAGSSRAVQCSDIRGTVKCSQLTLWLQQVKQRASHTCEPQARLSIMPVR